jgi:hypothetical protein
MNSNYINNRFRYVNWRIENRKKENYDLKQKFLLLQLFLIFNFIFLFLLLGAFLDHIKFLK